MKKFLTILLKIGIFLNIVFLTSMHSFVYASAKMAPYLTKAQIERKKIFTILFWVVMILGKVIYGMKRESQNETFKQQTVTQKPAVTVAQIIAKRESVYIGDDATAPNARMINILETDLLSDMVEKLARDYLPLMPNSVWAVDSGNRVIAYIITDDRKGLFSYELCLSNQLFLETGIKALYCSYFSSYGEKLPPIETAKRSMKRHFIEKLRIDDGSLYIWGELVGQLHIIETVEWNDEEIRIHFAEGYLHIYRPTNVINEKNQLIIGQAMKVLWIWYESGKAHTHENMYIRQYTKTRQGIILRAEGKQSDIRDDDGVVFQPLNEQAVYLEQNTSSVSHIPETDY